MASMYERKRGSTLQIYDDIDLVVLELHAPKDNGAKGCFNLEIEDVSVLIAALEEARDKAQVVAEAIASNARDKRRKELSVLFAGSPRAMYEACSDTAKNAINHIIGLEAKDPKK